MSKQYVIVIGRQFGSGGREIGEKLAAKLGIPPYDKTILGKVAQEQQVEDERLRKMDEYLNGHRILNIGMQAVTPSWVPAISSTTTFPVCWTGKKCTNGSAM